MRHLNATINGYRLADHVRACSVDGQIVLLDLRRNRYLGVGGPHAPLLAQFIIDWPASTNDLDDPFRHEGVSRWLETLGGQDLLAPADGTRQANPVLDEALDSISTAIGSHARTADWRRLADMARAAAGASYWLRKLSLADIADRVGRLKLSIEPRQNEVRDIDLESAVFAYERLRPFLFTAHDQCLHDSLSLMRFLARNRIFPRWVIGVKTRPFAAHSWVQAGHLVLNDAPEHVRRYTPVLVV